MKPSTPLRATRRCCAPMSHVWSIALALSATFVAAAPTEEEWARCAAFEADATRLACYDALYRRVQTPPGAPGTVAATAAAKVPEPVPSAARVAPPVRQPYDPSSFGFTPEQQHLFDPGPASITVRITGMTESQFAPTVISLDNNQTWSVMDNDGRLATGDTVRIKHAAMGAFIMLTRSNHTYHVKRLR